MPKTHTSAENIGWIKHQNNGNYLSSKSMRCATPEQWHRSEKRQTASTASVMGKSSCAGGMITAL
ncbi:hypothetical protein T10_11588 [Trichinella papuae]|uniref:Uncharacterized protein n=1 Tax=Trichinella papuae TaxID=268474 RepID=A0A0V1MFI4_9BILA|nr:hypothetical protein T10_11588 [Trichinella papuae]